MEPSRHPQATLQDLLNRALDRGLVINADLVIYLAGVPLLGVNLRAAIAGMETMLQYGLMKEWDEQLRASAQNKLEAASLLPAALPSRECLEAKDV
ncbi:MAG: gas vesicle protein [Chloroflexi bacterium]|nr:gas vesicle protein [Chloroflexota bacterium]